MAEVALGSTPSQGRSYKPSRVQRGATTKPVTDVPRMTRDSKDGVVNTPRASRAQGWIEDADKVEYE